MRNDPIVEEVRKARQEYAKRFNFDLHAMAEDLKEKERRHQGRLVAFPPKPARGRLTA
jgi:hypothetical protein